MGYRLEIAHGHAVAVDAWRATLDAYLRDRFGFEAWHIPDWGWESGALEVAGVEAFVDDQLDAVDHALGSFFAACRAATAKQYQGDFGYLAKLLGTTRREAAKRLVDVDHDQGLELLLDLRQSLRANRRSASTRHRALSTVNRFVKFAAARGLTRARFAIELPAVAPAYHDDLEPLVAARRVVALLAADTAPRVMRLRAILAITTATAARASELCALDVADWETPRLRLADLASETWSFLLGVDAASAVDAWLTARGAASGPLFLTLDRTPGRPAARSLQRWIADAARRYGGSFSVRTIRNARIHEARLSADEHLLEQLTRTHSYAAAWHQQQHLGRAQRG